MSENSYTNTTVEWVCVVPREAEEDVDDDGGQLPTLFPVLSQYSGQSTENCLCTQTHEQLCTSSHMTYRYKYGTCGSSYSLSNNYTSYKEAFWNVVDFMLYPLETVTITDTTWFPDVCFTRKFYIKILQLMFVLSMYICMCDIASFTMVKI